MSFLSYLVSYPRSGNHLVRTICEYITQLPSLGVNDHFDIAISKRTKSLHFDIKNEDIYCVKKCHIANIEIKNEEKNDANKKMILILRHPFECILSELSKRINHLSLDWLISNNGYYINQEFEIYKENIKYYLEWQGPKLLIFYEELVNSENVDQIIKFFDVENKKIDFDWEKIKECGLESLFHQPTSQNDIEYYRKKYPIEDQFFFEIQNDDIKNILIEKYPNLRFLKKINFFS